MTFQELVNALAVTAGKIEVKGDVFPTDNLKALFQNFFLNDLLSLSAASSTPDWTTHQVAVIGTLLPSSCLNLTDGQIDSGVFQWIDDNTITALLPITVKDKDWKLSQSFPTLISSIFDNVTYDKSIFTLDSTDKIVLPDTFRKDFGFEPDVPIVAKALAKGLSLSSDLTFDSKLLNTIGNLIANPISVAGPVEVYFQPGVLPTDPTTAYPQLLLDLTSDSGQTRQIGEYTMTFDLQIADVLQEFPCEDKQSATVIPAPIFALRTALVTTTTPTYSIPISAFLYSGDQPRLVFNVGEPPLDEVAKDNISSLLNNTDTGTLLEPGNGFPEYLAVTVQRLSVVINPSPLTLQQITLGIAIGQDKNWQMFDGFVTVNDIEFQATVTNSAGKYAPTAVIYANAQISNNDIELEAYVSLPDLTFGCALTIDATLDLTQAVKNIVGSSIGLPVITGGGFTLLGDVVNKDYEFEALVKETWNLFGSQNPDNSLQDFDLKLSYKPIAQTNTAKLGGSLTANLMLGGGKADVSATYDPSDSSWTFVGETAPDQELDLALLLFDLLAVFGIPTPGGLPKVLLSQFKIQYNTVSKDFLIAATVTAPAASYDLTSLPLVGKYLDPADTISLKEVDFNFSKTAKETDATLTFIVDFGTMNAKIEIPLVKKPATNNALPAVTEDPPTTYPAEGSGDFTPAQKTFGPIEISKLGFTLNSKGLGVQFDAGLSLAVLQIDILGLQMAIELTSPFTPSFDISGLEVTYKSPGIEISGGLLKIDVPASGGLPAYMLFNGELLIKAASFSITAFGSYATLSPPSFFIFALVNIPIGGPPFLFVTGFSGGFGFNRNLALPSIDQVVDYPLVAGASPDTNPFGPTPDLKKFLEVMGDEIGVMIGEDWLAAGLAFTSFKTVNSDALLTVAFGTRLQIAIIGISTIAVPPLDPKPVAMAQLALEASFCPDTGEFFIAAQLTTNSYVLAKACHLTGGFAFYLWFAPSPQAGQFVVSLGGYNPYFTVPAYYPAVPRLGFNWAVDNSPLVIKGGAYLALTPHSVMAGMALSATWETGNIKAWFTMNADFLIQWKPFHYDIQVGVSFGVTAVINLAFVKVTISISVGANLHIWGPDFTGTATIDLGVISFTISFGAGSSLNPPPIGWDEFQTSFLPDSSAPVQATAALSSDVTPTDSLIKALFQSGLLKDLTNAGAEVQYAVDPQTLSIMTQLMIPAKDLSFNGQLQTGTWNRDFGIGPMGLDNDDFICLYSLTVTYFGANYDRLTWSVTQNLAPKALWIYDTNIGKALNDPPQIANVVTGVTIQPKIDAPDHSLPIKIEVLLYDDDLNEDWTWSLDIAPTTDPFKNKDPLTTLTSTINDPTVSATREGIIANLINNGFDVSSQIDVDALTDPNRLEMLDPVVLNLLGYAKEAS